MKQFQEEGPQQIIIPEQKFMSCSRCKYFSNDLLKSGKNPKYKSNCNHPSIAENKSLNLFCGNLHENLNRIVETPTWCPFLKTESKEK